MSSRVALLHPTKRIAISYLIVQEVGGSRGRVPLVYPDSECTRSIVIIHYSHFTYNWTEVLSLSFSLSLLGQHL